MNLTDRIKRDLNITILPWVDRSGRGEETIVRFCLNRSNVDFLATSRDLVEEYLVSRNVSVFLVFSSPWVLPLMPFADQPLSWFASPAVGLVRRCLPVLQQQAPFDHVGRFVFTSFTGCSGSCFLTVFPGSQRLGSSGRSRGRTESFAWPLLRPTSRPSSTPTRRRRRTPTAFRSRTTPAFTLLDTPRNTSTRRPSRSMSRRRRHPLGSSRSLPLRSTTTTGPRQGSR